MSDAVLHHYKTLSGLYAENANRHSNERYRIECLRWLSDVPAPVLDVGCGTAHFLTGLRSALNVYGIDSSFPMLSAGPGTGFVVNSNAEQIPFADDSFGGAICINVLEHVPAPIRVLEELARIVKTGGRLVLITPADEWSLLLNITEKLHLKLPEGPHRFLKTGELLETAARAGLAPLAYRKILPFPFGDKNWVQAGLTVEKWFPGGFLHFMVAHHVR